MFLTRECDYGIRVVRNLADGTKKKVENIAEEEHIPQKYAYKIVKKLEKAGFIVSIRGRGGGCRLHRPLENFTLVDIVLAIDPERFLNECLKKDSDCPFKINTTDPCAVHHELLRIQEVLLSEMSSKSLATILRLEAAYNV